MSKVEVKSTYKVSDGEIAVEYETDNNTIYFWNENRLEGSFDGDYIDLLTDLLTELRKEKKDGE